MSGEQKWIVGEYLIGLPPSATATKAGLVYRGLGLHHEYDDSWSLTHLNSGHRAFTIYGLFGEVLAPATAIAEAADWTFKGLRGWKADPDFLAKIDKATKSYGEQVVRGVSADNNSDAVANTIASVRGA